jgi:hypothetical protein
MRYQTERVGTYQITTDQASSCGLVVKAED